MTAATDDDSLQDLVADYDGEGRERGERDSRDSGVVMMAATKMVAAEDSGGGQQWRWRRTMAMDDDSTQDWVADYNGEGQSGRQTMLALGIKQRRRCCFWQGLYIFLLCVQYVIFGGGHTILCVWGVLLTKRESCTHDSVYYLRREKMTKNTFNIMFLGRMF
jgi:hypothetical protein